MPKLEDIAHLKFPEEMTFFLWPILREQHEDSNGDQATFPHFDDFPLRVAAQGVRLAVFSGNVYTFNTLEEVELIREVAANTQVRYSWVGKRDYNHLLEVYDLMTLGRQVRDPALVTEGQKRTNHRWHRSCWRSIA